jgi:drug/metabolite transporter (DMT)-like permease
MGVPSLEQGFFRIILTTFFFGLIILVRPKIRRIEKRDVNLFMFNGLFGVSLSIFAYLSSIALGTPVAVAVTLSYLQPMFSVILARALLSEAVSALRLAAVAVSIVGASIVSGLWQVFGAGTQVNVAGVVLASCNGFFYAVYVIVGRLSGSKKNYSPATTTFYSFLFALIWMPLLWLLAAYLIGQQIVSGLVLDLSGQALALLVLIGVLGTIMPYGLLSLGLRSVKASIAAVILLVEPISVMIMGVLILGEPLTSWGILGSVLILSATVLVSIEARMDRIKKNRNRNPSKSIDKVV